MIFEGEYLNGKKHGIGKEYDRSGRLKFEGEYLYNYRRRGKCYIKNKLEFEGEFLFDKKYSGIGYDENGKIKYELKNGNGNVIEYYEERVIFIGNYLNGFKHGFGSEFDKYDGKLIYKGEFLNGKKHGPGKEYDNGGKVQFRGKFLNGERVPNKCIIL